MNNGIKQACMVLLGSNLMIGAVMSMVYYLGKESIASYVIIYAPISMISYVLIRDKYPIVYTFSNLLALGHGVAHVVYPFLNEHTVVNKDVAVWQDQIVHTGESILVSALFFNNSSLKFKVLSICFMLCNFINIYAGYCCWGKWCHNIYTWAGLPQALASGLHVATGCLFQHKKDVVTYGFVIQGTSSLITFFLFKSSDDMLKLFALCRFFEVYFIVPHYIGFFYGRYVIYKRFGGKNNGFVNGFLEVIGVLPSNINQISNTEYFGDTQKID